MYDLTSAVRRISALSKSFLPMDPRPVFSAREEDGMHAFRLLAHAEFERLIEGWAQEMNQQLAVANAHGKLPSEMKLHVLLHFEQARGAQGYPPKQISASRLLRPVKNKNSNDRIKAALSAHSSLIDGNNGVSQKDILKLFMPVGVELSWFNRQHSWLDSMDALASARGDVAHGGVGARTAPTPSGERSMLVQPLSGLRSLSFELRRIGRTLL